MFHSTKMANKTKALEHEILKGESCIAIFVQLFAESDKKTFGAFPIELSGEDLLVTCGGAP